LTADLTKYIFYADQAEVPCCFKLYHYTKFETQLYCGSSTALNDAAEFVVLIMGNSDL
jgi:hypothetical protein